MENANKNGSTIDLQDNVVEIQPNELDTPKPCAHAVAVNSRKYDEKPLETQNINVSDTPAHTHTHPLSAPFAKKSAKNGTK